MDKETKNTFETYVSKMISEQEEKLDVKFIKDFLFSLETEEKFCIPAEKLLEWKVYKQKGHLKRQLKNLFSSDGKNFLITKVPTKGRPSEKIMMTVDCFKKVCMMASSEIGEKVRDYYLVLEKLFRKYCEEEFQKQLEEKDKINLTLAKNLTEEQERSIKMEKSLMATQKKFTHRYKFPSRPCVYILKDPDSKFGKYKIGMTKNINKRLESDRTMIPTIKVHFIYYTPHYELFEKVIKVKHCENMELPSHEWVYEQLEVLIESYKEIDKACGFNSVMEKNLWRYNMEEPPSEMIVNNVSIKVKTKKNNKPQERKYIPKIQNKLEEKLEGLLPERILRYEYVNKNKESPEGMRYCNGFCQNYQPIGSFTKQSASYRTICKCCEHLVDVAHIRLEAKQVTKQEIRDNPTILKMGENEMMCRKCNKIKDKSEFPPKRKQCKKCRYSVKSKYGNKFDSVVEEEVKKLKELDGEDLDKKLGVYVKTELCKIMTYVKVGRKYNDKKDDMVRKLREYFT